MEAVHELGVLDEPCVEVVVYVLVEVHLRGCAVTCSVLGSVPVLVRRSLSRGDELREHARESVHLMAAELRAGGGSHRIGRQHALEPEHESVAHLQAGSGLRVAGRDLGERIVERSPPGGSERERGAGVLAVVEKRLTEPRLGSACRFDQVVLGVRRQCRNGLCFVHARSTYCRAAPSEELTLACLSGERYRQSIPQKSGEAGGVSPMPALQRAL